MMELFLPLFVVGVGALGVLWLLGLAAFFIWDWVLLTRGLSD